MFDEPTHTYTKNSVVYRNVSQLVEKYSPPFPKEEAALRTAVSQKTTPEKIIKRWKDLGEVSKTYGSAIDLAVRYWIDHGDIPRPTLLAGCIEEFIDLTWGMKLTANIMLAHDDLQIAGTTDIFKHDKEEKDIWDVKTNASLKKGRGKMLGPFSDLPATNLNKYRLQLSLYKLLAEFEGHTINKIGILHWTDKWKMIEVEPLDLTEFIELESI